MRCFGNDEAKRIFTVFRQEYPLRDNSAEMCDAASTISAFEDDPDEIRYASMTKYHGA